MTFPFDRGLAPLALRQLEAWQTVAQAWETGFDRGCLRCVSCGQSIARMSDASGVAYHYDNDQLLALVVLHLRECHKELDPDVPHGATVLLDAIVHPESP